MKLTDRLSASSDVIAREVGGETILLDLASGNYFGLDPVGTRVWQLIEEEGCTLGEACDVLVGEYDVAHAELEKDLLALAENMADQQLISTSEA